MFYRFYLFLERGEGSRVERVRNIDVWLPPMCPALGTPGHNLDRGPDWESHQ